MSDANRGEAARCMDIARGALAASDFTKAQRFAEKALRLFPTDEVRKLRMEIDRKQSSAQASTAPSRSASAPPGTGDGPNLRPRAARANSTAGGPSAVEQDLGTPEQKRLVRHIIATKDYYAMLAVEKGASEDELKRGYKKLALKLHPDKNQAAGSSEAFKAVSRAYACLSDPEKRANYDRFGHEDQGQLGRRGGGGRGMYAQDQFDPDELFNMFFGGGGFGGGFGGGRTRVYTNFGGHPFGQRQQAAGQPGQPANPLAQLLHFAPVVLLILFTFFSGSSEPAVSLDKRGDFTQQYNTARYDVPFFAKPGNEFQRSYPKGSSSRVRLEQNIEHEYKDRLQNLCHRERLDQLRASRFGSKERAQTMELPHCNEIWERFGYRYSPGFAY